MSRYDYEPCLICGENVNTSKRHWRVHMLWTREIVSFDSDSSDSQGTFAIGPRCRKELGRTVDGPHDGSGRGLAKRIEGF